jgi:peroxiredoxin
MERERPSTSYGLLRVSSGSTARRRAVAPVTSRSNPYQAIADNDAVLLLCYPFDCSPVCSGEPCALRDAEWFELLENVETWAVSSDSVYAHREFADKYDISFPLPSNRRQPNIHESGAPTDW